MAIVFLLIDDDTDDSDLLYEALKEIDSSVQYEYASDGPEALSMLERIDRPDLIFLDINMPGMSGWQCLSKIKAMEAFKDIPVIMYSTSSYQYEIDKAFELGALSFFTKPNHYKLLKKNIQLLLDAVKSHSLESYRNTVLDSVTQSERKH